VEKDPLKRKTLLQNVSLSPVRINCRFVNAELYVKRAKRPFHFIFLDPPFPYQFKWELIARVAASSLVQNESVIAMHRPQQDCQKEEINLLKRYDSREYGRSVVDFFAFFREE